MGDLVRATTQELLDELQSRKDHETARALYKMAGTREPMFVQDWHETSVAAQMAADDLYEVMEWLRATKNFEQSDRVRTIAARLAQSVPPHPRFSGWGNPELIRNIARTWPVQLTVAEGKKLQGENERLRDAIAKIGGAA